MVVLAALALVLASSGVRIREGLHEVDVRVLEIKSYVHANVAAECIVTHFGWSLGAVHVGNNTLSLPTRTPRSRWSSDASSVTPLLDDNVALQCSSGVVAMPVFSESREEQAILKFRMVDASVSDQTENPGWTAMLQKLLLLLLLLLTIGCFSTNGCCNDAVAGAMERMRTAERNACTQDSIKRRRKWLLKNSEPDECVVLLQDLQDGLVSSAIEDERPAWMPRNADAGAPLPSRAERLLVQKIAGEFSACLVAQAAREIAAKQIAKAAKQQHSTNADTVTREEFRRARRSLYNHIDCRRCVGETEISAAEVMKAAALLRGILAASPGSTVCA